MTHSIYTYIFVMAAVTYLIRMLPLVLLKKKIRSLWIRNRPLRPCLRQNVEIAMKSSSATSLISTLGVFE